MSLKIIRNDITKMQVDAIVNTANKKPTYGPGVDTAIYKAAGEQKLLEARGKIGSLEEGQVCITPGFGLSAQYIIHAVSPLYDAENPEVEQKLRGCYKKSLDLAVKNNCKSIAFPLISTGNYGYPKEEGMRIALDEINAFLEKYDILVYLVVFDKESTELGEKISPKLTKYIDQNYVDEQSVKEYDFSEDISSFFERNQNVLEERMRHVSDTFQQYLFYLIEKKGMANSEVYKRAILTKQLFSKIKLNKNYHPDKGTAMRLCIGAKLNLIETKDILARAGYALSPCDKRDIIFVFFIENKIYDMIEIDIALEENGLPCFIE